ncbi:hypothetical protein IEO21_07658 [Rhodonia placenta]|uniref:H-type lectin domain-containing protein n=2 Tax=Rhodonia placenta TaxID=104341 RepID=A0A1X6N7L5_9APHY|nr:hypothetical protein POSPLADRAFT_1166721 [Postia placenta MAD-698-R-SB12]KAF9808969.1 hypothetical protein IEO21_07658 [Postia placenta]OSX64617.1 hypothetical protein POSPLADRAFT_1166721 [Postia placenta MAD-698-R-SB12]
MSTTGAFNTGEVRPWNKPQLLTSRDIAFDKPFVAAPQLPIGLNWLDIDANADIRVKAYATNITKESFTAHIDSWSDTTFYSGGANWPIITPAHLEYQCGQFSTEEDHPWDKPQTTTQRRISFSRPFVTPPKVICFFNQVDIDKNHNWRAKTYVSDVDATGFTIHIDTWFDTILYSATAGWVAYPEDREYVFSGTANTMDVRPWEKPQLENSAQVKVPFDFWKVPKVFMAINQFDIECGHNLRLKVHADNVTANGFTWHIDSWNDTVQYSAGFSYLCVV